MALEGTHIRIAIEVSDLLDIKDYTSYISGTIYPDSRYLTKVDRDKTHLLEYHIDDSTSDFNKGWFIHLMCDEIQFELLHKIFSNFLNLDDPLWWEKITTLKIIQDIEALKNFNIQIYLKHLKYYNNPNNENLSDINRYNTIMFDMYNNKNIITIDDAYEMWLRLGVSNEKGNKVKGIAKNLIKDSGTVQKIRVIYDMMLNILREKLGHSLT